MDQSNGLVSLLGKMKEMFGLPALKLAISKFSLSSVNPIVY